MMKSINALIILLFSLLFCSCDKSIEGRVIDNFGTPIKDAEITIKGSGFKATTDKNGDFNIDYASGRFLLKFAKNGYLTDSVYLEIAEKQHYPLKEMMLHKALPERTLFFKGESDYIEIPKVALNEQKEYEKSSGFFVSTITDYNLSENDTVFVIRIKEVKNVEFYDSCEEELWLITLSDGVAIVKKSGGFLRSSYYSAASKKEHTTFLNSSVRTHRFTPEIGETYFYCSVRGARFSSITNVFLAETYAFRFELVQE